MIYQRTAFRGTNDYRFDYCEVDSPMYHIYVKLVYYNALTVIKE